MKAKKWWTSKLVWLGVIEVGKGIVDFIFALPPDTAIFTIIMGILTIISRVLWTNQPISGAPGAKTKG